MANVIKKHSEDYNCASLLPFRHLPNLQILDICAIDCETQHCSDVVKAINTRRARIQMKTLQLFIIHYFKDVRMTAHKNLRMLCQQHLAGFGLVSARIATDMRHHNFRLLHCKHLKLRHHHSHLSIIDITINSHHGPELAQIIEQLRIANVASVPNLVDRFKKLAHIGIKMRVSVRE